MVIKKGDCVELIYTARSNNEIVDTNDPKNLEKAPKPLRLFVGEHMIIPGLDKAMEGKEVGVENHVHIPFTEGFGPRYASMVKPVPLSLFASQNVMPRPGMSFLLDQTLVQVRSVSGARVTVDFNSPLAGKNLDYTFTITRLIDDVKEKTTIFCERLLRHTPPFEIKENTIVITLLKAWEPITQLLKEKAKTLLGKELEFNFTEKAPESVSPKSEEQQSL